MSHKQSMSVSLTVCVTSAETNGSLSVDFCITLVIILLPDLLYNPDEEHALKGTYEFSPSTELSVTYNGSNTELTSAEVQTVKDAVRI